MYINLTNTVHNHTKGRQAGKADTRETHSPSQGSAKLHQTSPLSSTRGDHPTVPAERVEGTLFKLS